MGSTIPSRKLRLPAPFPHPGSSHPKPPTSHRGRSRRPEPRSSRIAGFDHARREEAREAHHFDGAVTDYTRNETEKSEIGLEPPRRPDKKMPSVEAFDINYGGAGKAARQHPVKLDDLPVLHGDKDNGDQPANRDDWPFAIAPRYCRRCKCFEGCRNVKLSPSIRRKRRGRRRRFDNCNDQLQLPNPKVARRLFSPEPSTVARVLFGPDLDHVDIARRDQMSHLSAADAPLWDLDENNILTAPETEWVIDCRGATPTR